ncbi:hypothetical protein OK016_11145 [Vibrio chagasii]|nr:hypothetical protein [Vibrio chagasii]
MKAVSATRLNNYRFFHSDLHMAKFGVLLDDTAIDTMSSYWIQCALGLLIAHWLLNDGAAVLAESPILDGVSRKDVLLYHTSDATLQLPISWLNDKTALIRVIY